MGHHAEGRDDFFPYDITFGVIMNISSAQVLQAGIFHFLLQAVLNYYFFAYSSNTFLRSFGLSVMMASTPFSINMRISSSSLIVQY